MSDVPMNRRPYDQRSLDQLRNSRTVQRLLATIDQLRRQENEAAVSCDPAAERLLLATAWVNADFVMVMRLEAEDFVDPFCKWLLGHLRALVDADEPMDVVALMRRVRRPGGMEGLSAFDRDSLPGSLAELMREASPTTAHLEFYFGVLRIERLRRAIGRLADEMRKRSEKRLHDPPAVLAWAGEQIARLLTKAPQKKPSESEPTPAT